jgi:hypothetical protein
LPDFGNIECRNRQQPISIGGRLEGWIDDKTFPVEFSDDQGHAYAVAPCRREDLLVYATGVAVLHIVR